MTGWRALAALLLVAAPAGAAPPRLVPDVSERRIDIVYSFRGAELLLFGAILYPGGKPPSGRTDVAVVVRGPDTPLTVREKAKVAGIWLNHASQRFVSVPAFYAIASSRPLDQMMSARVAARHQLGIGNLRLSPRGAESPAAAARFAEGLVGIRRGLGLYVEDPGGVGIDQDVLYRARIAIPARVAVGRYTAETFLVRDGRVVASAAREILIGKSGFERFVAVWAVRSPVLYGLAAVLLSLGLGWAAATLFGRRGS